MFDKTTVRGLWAAAVLASVIGLADAQTYTRGRRQRGAKTILRLLLAAALVASAATVRADVFSMGGTQNADGTWTGLASLQFVTVGDPGNVADPATGGLYGSVPYIYRMGTFDVTMAQYTAFLNAVATKSDPYGLYNSNMGTDFSTLGIARSGGPGSYSYSVTGSAPGANNMPVFFVSWGDAARFCNWLENGQPTSGTEATGTTETGAYTLNGDTTTLLETRNAGATYFLPSENEWYKAAYYVGGGTNAGYWTYPTRSNSPPSNVLSATGTNNANYRDPNLVFTDPTNYLTPVGSFADSPGPYGTYDMAGDVWQWNEASIYGAYRGIGGGSWDGPYEYLASSNISAAYPIYGDGGTGFRVASVPEPGNITLLLAGAVGVLAFAWRRKTRAT
ncbi:MAG: SUMF1/EgtB/PvdO family nonheme iron enzyme [Thermoguttaceae bacterium]